MPSPRRKRAKAPYSCLSDRQPRPGTRWLLLHRSDHVLALLLPRAQTLDERRDLLLVPVPHIVDAHVPNLHVVVEHEVEQLEHAL